MAYTNLSTQVNEGCAARVTCLGNSSTPQWSDTLSVFAPTPAFRGISSASSSAPNRTSFTHPNISNAGTSNTKNEELQELQQVYRGFCQPRQEWQVFQDMKKQEKGTASTNSSRFSELLLQSETRARVSSDKNHLTNIARKEAKDSNVGDKKYNSGGRLQGGGDVQRVLNSLPQMVTRSQARLGLPLNNKRSENLLRYNEESRRHKQERWVNNEVQKNLQYSKIRHDVKKVKAFGFNKIKSTNNTTRSGIEFGSVCKTCGAVAVTKIGWMAHQAAHRNKSTACKYCCSVFLNAYGRDLHQDLHKEGHTSEVDDYCECALCGGAFINIMYLELHLLDMHGTDALHNSQSFVLGSAPNPHFSFLCEIESTEQLFRCGVCYARFTYSFNLDCHMALHTQMCYACGLCDSAYSSLNLLVNHCNVHLGINTAAAPFNCPPLKIQDQKNRSPEPPVLIDVDLWGDQSGDFHYDGATSFTDSVNTPVFTTSEISPSSPFKIYNSDIASGWPTVASSASKCNFATVSKTASDISDSTTSRFKMTSRPESATSFTKSDSCHTSNFAPVIAEGPLASPWGLDANNLQRPSTVNLLHKNAFAD
ncbi:uncharacterized protein [Cherax quadricarinatus]|uniref:uncharacterized protein n=1 Tax=Cherax quadricarinatus TaxID=27406 RepID=UPI0023782073|nr:uncharacterized protein LOC128698143 [Cherax quadricarinatus]